jgi:dTDP-4-amino-4,6-dideoxygalactose transaminase
MLENFKIKFIRLLSTIKMTKKYTIEELAIFGGESLFNTAKSTSNLVQPNFENFLNYSKIFFKQGQYTNDGPLVKILEHRLAFFHETKYCITFCNGFWTLVLAISALAKKNKTEIIMPSLTYRRMADIAAWNKLKPHFCEVDPKIISINAITVAQCINNNTALILAVHPIVNVCDVDGLVKLSKDKNIPLLFDSVESVYESTNSGKIGCFGDAEIFSLHASKLLNGFEGGYLTTNNENLANKLALMRGFGFQGSDQIVVPNGINAKLNEIHAAMALASLDDLDDQILRNKKRYYTYKKLFLSIPGIRLVEFDENHQTSYKNIVIELLDNWPINRKNTLQILNYEKILARAYYSPALHQNPMKNDHVPSDLPITNTLSEKFMLLPCGHLVSNDDIVKIIKIFRLLYTEAKSINSRMQSNG